MTFCPVCERPHTATREGSLYSLTKAGHLYLAQLRAEERAAALKSVSGEGVGWGVAAPSPTAVRASNR